jgi:hypothetical protein
MPSSTYPIAEFTSCHMYAGTSPATYVGHLSFERNSWAQSCSVISHVNFDTLLIAPCICQVYFYIIYIERYFSSKIPPLLSASKCLLNACLEVLTAVMAETEIFWDMTPCRSVNLCRYLRETHCLHLQAIPKRILLRRWRTKASPKRQSIFNSVFPKLFTSKETPKLFCIPKDPWHYIIVNWTKKQLLAQEDYSRISNGLIKIPTLFRGMFGIFHVISKFVLIYSKISRGKPNDVLWNPG